MPAPTLDCGRTYTIASRFEFADAHGVEWELNAGQRITVMERIKGGLLRVRAGVLTFNVGAEWLAARVTATEER